MLYPARILNWRRDRWQRDERHAHLGPYDLHVWQNHLPSWDAPRFLWNLIERHPEGHVVQIVAGESLSLLESEHAAESALLGVLGLLERE